MIEDSFLTLSSEFFRCHLPANPSFDISHNWRNSGLLYGFGADSRRSGSGIHGSKTDLFVDCICLSSAMQSVLRKASVVDVYLQLSLLPVQVKLTRGVSLFGWGMKTPYLRDCCRQAVDLGPIILFFPSFLMLYKIYVLYCFCSWLDDLLCHPIGHWDFNSAAMDSKILLKLNTCMMKWGELRYPM